MQKTVLNLAKVVVVNALGGEPFVKASCLESTSSLILRKVQAMPVWLKWPVFILTFLFDISGILSTGRLFQAQSFSQQVRTVGLWQDSRIKVFRDFIKFYEKLTLFIYFSI